MQYTPIYSNLQYIFYSYTYTMAEEDYTVEWGFEGLHRKIEVAKKSAAFSKDLSNWMNCFLWEGTYEPVEWLENLSELPHKKKKR